MKYLLVLGCFTALVAVASPATATIEIQKLARAATVAIKLQNNDILGSGVIIYRQGDLYTLVTNRHVVCGGKLCNQLPPREKYRLTTADDQQYPVSKSAIKLLGDDLDLAVIQFRSNRQYPVVLIAPPGSLRVPDVVYTAGFPLQQKGFSFNKGKAVAVVNKRLKDDRGGYSIIYNAETAPGMSGGGVFNTRGELVAIHGVGDRYQLNTVLNDTSRLNNKIGYNRGIPVRWLVQNLPILNSGKPLPNNGGNLNNAPTTADEHFITALNKANDPGADVLAGKREAIQELDATIKLNPKYAIAYHLRCYLYIEFKEDKQAMSDCNQSIAIDPQFSGSYVNRGSLRKDLNDFPGAYADYNQAIALNPKSAYAYNNRALLKESENNLQGALADFDQSIKINPQNSNTYENRASVKVKLKDYQGALADYNQSLAINPRDASVFVNRGIFKQNIKDYQGAMADYDQAIKIDPKNIYAYNNRGIVKEDQFNNYAGAMADYNSAISIDPKFSSAYNSRASLKLYRLKDYDGALADYNQAIILNPKFAMAYRNRGNLKTNYLKDFPGALADYDQAVAIDPKNIAAYRNRGKLKDEKLLDWPGAIADYSQIIKLAPQDVEAYQLRAFVKLRLKDLPGATADMDLAIEMSPNDGSAYFRRGLFRQQITADRVGAIKDFRQAAKLFKAQKQKIKLILTLKELQSLGIQEE